MWITWRYGRSPSLHYCVKMMTAFRCFCHCFKKIQSMLEKKILLKRVLLNSKYNLFITAHVTTALNITTSPKIRPNLSGHREGGRETLQNTSYLIIREDIWFSWRLMYNNNTWGFERKMKRGFSKTLKAIPSKVCLRSPRAYCWCQYDFVFSNRGAAHIM